MNPWLPLNPAPGADQVCTVHSVRSVHTPFPAASHPGAASADDLSEEKTLIPCESGTG